MVARRKIKRFGKVFYEKTKHRNLPLKNKNGERFLAAKTRLCGRRKTGKSTVCME
jgi:hypothetical protein